MKDEDGNLVSINGLFKGEADGFDFEFCIRTLPNTKLVTGVISFITNPKNSLVYLDGQIYDDVVRLDYRRNSKHPDGPDFGKVVLTALNEKRYRGYWYSERAPENRQRLNLEQIDDTCELNWFT